MTDTQETLQSALADLTRRVAAFEKAQKKADVEPERLQPFLVDILARGEGAPNTKRLAAARLRTLLADRDAMDKALSRAVDERNAARATLAAVRKIAESDAAMNPCAVEILNVMEAKKP